MMGITGVCCRWVGDLVQAFGVTRSTSPPSCLDPNPTCVQQPQNQNAHQVDDDLMMQALTAAFGMEENGRIKKEKARRVVEKLGLIFGEEGQEQPSGGGAAEAEAEDYVPAEEVLSGLENGSDRHQLLQEAFKIFDEDGNGYIEAVELKRVLQCLGLDRGWEMSDMQRMLRAADLNLDGKIDFSEFELMMG